MRHRVVVVGGGMAGVCVTARLLRAGVDDVALVEPSSTHYYQPLWTLVGAGEVKVQQTGRSQARVVPRGVRWVQDRAAEIDPDRQIVTCEAGAGIGYEVLVLCPGVELAWDMVPGLAEACTTPYVSTNYTPELAPKTWEMVRRFRGGNALFGAPGSPIKCPGAPQKAAYLSCDYWRRTGRLSAAHVVFATGAPSIFGVPEFAAVLEGVVERYGIEARFGLELVEVDGSTRQATFEVAAPEGRVREVLAYDVFHTAPPQRAPRFIRDGPFADPSNPFGWIPVDRHTLRHGDYADVFALGDACSAPTSKTGAAIRRQAPVVVANVLDTLAGREPHARYEGYAACPFTTAQGRMLLAEFDYSGAPTPSIPFVDTQRERYDMWLLKKYGLPLFYWKLMLRGLA